MTDQPQQTPEPALNIAAAVQPNGTIVYQASAAGIINMQVILPTADIAESFLAGTTEQLRAAIDSARRARLGLILPGAPDAPVNGHQFQQPPTSREM